MNIDLMKLKDLLNPFQSSTGPYNPDMATGMRIPPLEPAGMMEPQDTQFEQLVGLLNSIPNRADYKPSKLRTISAAIAGLGAGGPAAYSGGAALGYRSNLPEGLKVQRALLDEPYDRAVNDWLTKSEPTLKTAQLENSRNTNQRLINSNNRNAQLRERGIENQENKTTQQIKFQEEEQARKRDEQKIRQQRADTYDYQARNPNKQFKEANGYLVALDPATGVGELVRDKDGDPIETGRLSDADKIDLQLSAAKSRISAQGNESRRTEENRQENRRELEDTRQKNRKEIQLTRLGKSGGKITIGDDYRLAVKAVNEHPEWADYVKFDDVHKTFQLTTPKEEKSFLGKTTKPAGDSAIAKQVFDYIYGGTKQAEIPDTQERVIITDGKKNFSLPASQVDKYLKLHPEFSRKGKK